MKTVTVKEMMEELNASKVDVIQENWENIEIDMEDTHVEYDESNDSLALLSGSTAIRIYDVKEDVTITRDVGYYSEEDVYFTLEFALNEYPELIIRKAV